MNNIPLVIFIIISAFSMNLTLQCALGIKGEIESFNCRKTPTIRKLCLIFFSVIFIWFLFSKIIFSIITGIFAYIIIFPVSFLLYELFEYLFFGYLIKRNMNDKESFINFPGGITAAAAFICINITGNFLEVLVLSFGFTGGIMLVIFIIVEIRKRAAFESVPVFLRGKPLVLISMSLLSLVFSTASLIILRMINIK